MTTVPSAVPSAQITERLAWRYATKHFDSMRKIPEREWLALEQVLVKSPSSLGMQPWKFIVVMNPELRLKLRAASYNQPQITEASHMVVFAGRTSVNVSDVDRHIQRVAAVRKADLASLSAYRAMMTGFVERKDSPLPLEAWAARQTYIALGGFLMAAALMGIDACPMEGFEPKEYDKILGLTDLGYTSVVVATAGYRAADDSYATLPKVRYETNEVVNYR